MTRQNAAAQGSLFFTSWNLYLPLSLTLKSRKGLVQKSQNPLFVSLLHINDNVNDLCASIMAGAAASLLLCPLEQTRIHMVTDPSFAGTGLISAVWWLVQQNGLGPILL